ncbi:MAG: hypothetical protein OEO82_07185 [Gammaproteobacteria bacterium]|nr:hypothetical protein [Gammaproteobacteria bacterium]
MNLRKSILLVALLGMAMTAFAADEVRTKMVIALVDGDGDDQTRIELNSEELGFNLHDMQVGENRSIVAEDGRTILITREADGFSFDVDGKTVKMPAMPGGPHGPGMPHGPIMIDGADDVDAHVVHGAHAGKFRGPGGITILSGKPIADATQQQIRTLLESAGHDSEVRFIDHESHHGGPHQMRIVEKRVETAE